MLQVDLDAAEDETKASAPDKTTGTQTVQATGDEDSVNTGLSDTTAGDGEGDEQEQKTEL